MEFPEESREAQRDSIETDAQAVPSQAANGNLASRTSSSAESAPTYISPGIKIKGTITADEDLYIDGDIKGSLSVPRHCVTIGERAQSHEISANIASSAGSMAGCFLGVGRNSRRGGVVRGIRIGRR